MNRFSSKYCINNRGEDAVQFVSDHVANSDSVLFIGTVGIQGSSLYFAHLLAKAKNVTFKFITECRPAVSPDLENLGSLHKAELERMLPNGKLEFIDVEIISGDGATVAGRNATKAAQPWLSQQYKDIVIDATGMSRGTCFPIVRQAMELHKESTTNIHLLMASSDQPAVKLKSESNSHADWMHGFQEDMETYIMRDALTLWVPQLTEDSLPSMNSMFSALMPLAEVCPIVPFPSARPRRGDELLLEYFDAFESQWDATAQNVIYAHEADPMDVFRSISRMHDARLKVFPDKSQSVTVLSPAGWRLGSLGMLLAAIDLSLPVLYVETIGYTTDSKIPESVTIPAPSKLWHVWLAGVAYDEITC
ncbi:hypothetical protein FFI39_002560 [Janthinobacterium sp. KBS0711]|uniref:hypothetical protein n=1 Tax=unclassified Janthinobacterium TaxID=2610881 RepID=UPI000564E336|nr:MULTISPECIES: hypothetical protein [unclassified Janthinobacterium]TSD69992.1 hypothetical protein FFI39_002560 [Janthinobacterium sp. KBS0711]